MKTIYSNNTNPYYNLALEEYLLKEKEYDCNLFYVWRNEPSIVFGRNQNPYNEINMKETHLEKLHIARRSSGGGTVYHDLGNINFTYITNQVSTHLNNYYFFLEPIIKILQQLGLDVRFVEKTHLYIGDKKISGNAQTFHKNRMLHHGTILFNIDMETASKVLTKKHLFKDKSVASLKAEIVNIKNKINYDTTEEELMSFILSKMPLYEDEELQLNDYDLLRIRQIQREKYETFNWIYGQSHSFIVENPFYIEVSEGVIKASKKYKQELESTRFIYTDVSNALSKVPEKEEILNLLFT